MSSEWSLESRRPLPQGAPGVVASSAGATSGGASALRWSGTAVMGVVNVTPDSFSDGGQFEAPDSAIEHGRRLAAAGALVVDVGGESTRPGSTGVAVEIELKRVLPVIEALAATQRTVISVDTRSAEVARCAIDAGANIVNIVGGVRDPEMLAVCARAGVPMIVMHMQGTPIDMQIDPHYADVVGEVTTWLQEQAAAARAAGVPSVMVDPGIGFGKTLEHNVSLLRALPLTTAAPVLVGVSRKRTVQQLAGLSADGDRDAASIAVALWAAQHGVAMVRVHDVEGHVAALAADRALRS